MSETEEKETEITEQDIISSEAEALDEVLAKLTDIEKRYCNVIVNQKPKSKADALKAAGSKANPKYLSKMAWEIEQRPHVQAYIEHLKGIVCEEAGLGIQEIIHNARRAIEMSFQNGKPRDADPHNRLLAEIGGFVRNQSATPQANVQVNTGGGALASESIEKDFLKIQLLAASQRHDEAEESQRHVEEVTEDET